MVIPIDIFHITILTEIQNDQKYSKFILQNKRGRTEISTFQSWMENIFRFKMKDIWKKKSCFCSCSLNNIRKSQCLVKPYVLNLLIHIYRVRTKLHFFFGRHFFSFATIRLERDKGYIWYSKSISRWMEECFFFFF